MHKILEQVEDFSALRTRAPGHDRPILARPFDQLLADDDRLDHHDPVVFDEGPHLVADGSERPVLDFHQAAAGDGVDAEVAERHFKLGIVAGVEGLQVAVQGGFHGAGRTQGLLPGLM